MIKINTFKLAVAGALCMAGASALTAQINYDRQEFWNKPHIQKAFLNSYEPNRTTEPKLNEDEQLLVKEMLKILQAESGGGSVAALEMLKPQLKADSSAALHFIAGNLYGEQGKINEAIIAYRTAVKNHKDFLRAIRNLAVMLVQQGEFEEPLKLFTQAIELGANDTTTYGLLGLCFVNTGKHISAETAYRQAIVLDPEVKDWKLGLAKSLLSQEKYEEAVTVLDEILTEEPENDIIWTSQANAFLGLQDLNKAVANQEIVDRLGKSTPESLTFMGKIYMSQGLSELALKNFLKAIQKDPNADVSIHVSTADVMVAQGAFEEASTFIQRIRANYSDKLSNEDSANLLRHEVKIGLAVGETADVVPSLERLLEMDPLDGQALMLLATYYTSEASSTEDVDQQVDLYTRADIYYDRATKIEEYEVDALIAHAQSYVAREKYGDAIPLLERAQTLEPRDHIGRYLQQVRKVFLSRVGL